MTRECHVRFCEGPLESVRRSTHQKLQDGFVGLKHHMGRNAIALHDTIVPDNVRRFCIVGFLGKLYAISYIAILDPLEEEGPHMICSYGLIDSASQYTYVVPRS
jgi:hypothetical protein